MTTEFSNPKNAMAHLLPPAGITYPKSDRFRNYLVRPPTTQQQKRELVICCERPYRAGRECRNDVRCQIRDGINTVAVKVCPDCSDCMTDFCRDNDCRPRPPLTQPGLLCYPSCKESRPPPSPRVCKSFVMRRPCRDPCDPCAPPCPKRCATPRPVPCTKTIPCPPCPEPCMPRGRDSCPEDRPRPRLVREKITTQCYTYQY